MTIQPLRSYESINFQGEQFIRPPRIDVYDICRFTEEKDPELARVAWGLHAEGYEEMGFVHHDAVTSEGFLAESIDKARGPLVDYYLAAGPNNKPDALPDAATMRKINLPVGGTVEDLPAYKLCENNLYPAEKKYLLSIDSPDERVKEIGALARTAVANPVSVFELMRNATHESLGKNEIWFFSIVSTTYDTLVKNFGESAIRQAGAPVAIDDARVSESVTLIPAIADVDKFCSEVYKAALDEQNPHRQIKKMRSFLFFIEGLRDDEIGDELATARQDLLMQKKEAS